MFLSLEPIHTSFIGRFLVSSHRYSQICQPKESQHLFVIFRCPDSTIVCIRKYSSLSSVSVIHPRGSRCRDEFGHASPVSSNYPDDIRYVCGEQSSSALIFPSSITIHHHPVRGIAFLEAWKITHCYRGSVHSMGALGRAKTHT